MASARDVLVDAVLVRGQEAPPFRARCRLGIDSLVSN